MIVDRIIPHVCVDESLQSIPGADAQLPPAPLLPNGGYASVLPYFVDMGMMYACNGKERTAKQIQRLLEQTGWKLEAVVPGDVLSTSKVIAIAA